MASIKRRTNALVNVSDSRELKQLLDATRSDLYALATDVAAIAAALDTLAAKLNADAGVTDEDYDTTNAAGLTSSTTLNLEA